MRWTRFVLVAVLLAGCTPSNGRLEPGEEDRAVSEDLAATVEVEVGGNGVRLGLHVTNTTPRPIELTFPTSQRYDFTVSRPSGETVWQWSAAMSFLQVISQATLAPGESWDMEAVWDAAGVSGELVATGRLTAQDHAVEQSTTFELP